MYLEEVNTEITPGLIARLKSGSVEGIRLAGCTPDLSPLLEVAERVLGLTVEGSGRLDWAPTRLLKNLQFFSASETSLAEVPFEAFKLLTAVDIGSRSDLPGDIGKCRSLRFLRVMRPSWRSLECLSGLTKLTSLTIIGGKLENLVVGRPVGSLRELSLHQVTRLQSLNGLEEFPGLRAVCISRSPHASDFHLLGKLAQLRELRLAGCELESLGFIRGCPKLEYLWLGSRAEVRDGDMTPLIAHERLRSLYCVRRKHYTHSLEEVAVARGLHVNDVTDMNQNAQFIDRNPKQRLEALPRFSRRPKEQ